MKWKILLPHPVSKKTLRVGILNSYLAPTSVSGIHLSPDADTVGRGAAFSQLWLLSAHEEKCKI